jgi:hypothetical protein
MKTVHHTHVFTTLEAFVSHYADPWREGGDEEMAKEADKFARKIWKRHVQKHGNVPLIRKCAVCSGEERRLDIKHGAFNPKRPSKRLRDEIKGEIK